VGLDGKIPGLLQRFGSLDAQGDWLTVRGISDDAVPDLVEAIIRLGGRVHEVEPARQSLEDRFLQLLDKE
jgi:hypothetical protein